MVKLVLGADEAGRGPVIGPMVIAAVLDTEESGYSYSEMGCKDSKLLSPTQREHLRPMIMAKAKEVHLVEISAADIDDYRKIMSLNELEAKKIAELIMMFDQKPDKIIIDCPDTDTNMFITRLRKYVDTDAQIISEHKADVNYPHVSAASIIAKTMRDQRIEEMKAKYGDFGSGYPSDPQCQAFLREYAKNHSHWPPFVRKSWDTAKRFMEERTQSTLNEY